MHSCLAEGMRSCRAFSSTSTRTPDYQSLLFCHKRRPSAQAKAIASQNLGLDLSYHQTKDVKSSEVAELLEKVDWPERTPEKITTAFQNSYLVASLQSSTPDGKRLVAIARAVSDGLNAQIWDVVVDPEFQGMGVGKRLVSEVVRNLNREGIDSITVFAEKQGVGFYEKLGFVSDPDNTKGMFYRQFQ